MKRYLFLAGLLIAGAVIATLIGEHLVRGFGNYSFLRDFRAFYCGGHVLMMGSDPYRVQPLLACENTVVAGSESGVAIPAPLPGYALATFALFALLPYTVAKTLALILMLMFYGIAVYGTSKLTGYAPVGIAAALGPVMYYMVNLGQLPSTISLCFLIVAALQIRDRRYALAGIACCAAAVEPHTALPSYLAMLMWLPSCRPALLLGAAFLAAISILALGLHGNIEYLSQVLPSHAGVEADHPFQYSATWLLHYFGVTSSRALFIGSLWYFTFIGLGLWMTFRFVRRHHGEEAFVLLPPMAAMLGGSFVHVQQIIATVPGGFYLASRAGERSPLLLAAILIVATPWLTVATDILYKGDKFLWLFSMTIALLFCAAFWLREGVPFKRRLTFAFLSVCIIGMCALSIRTIPDARYAAAPRADPAVIAPTQYASVSWKRYIDEIAKYNGPGTLLMKIPTWSCLAALIVAGFALGRKDRQIEGSSCAARVGQAT